MTAVGGTQLQDGWTWNPTSNIPFDPTASLQPGYWQSTQGGGTEAVWNESWGPIATGGGPSADLPAPVLADARRPQHPRQPPRRA